MAFRPSGYSVTLWAKNLKVFNPELYARTADKMEELEDGRVRILLNSLDEATRNELLGALPLISKMVPPDSLAENKAMNEAQIEAGRRIAADNNKREADKNAGMARLLEWAETGLLEDTRPNSEAITKWLQEYVKGYISVANIDTAIDILGPRGKNVLTWRKPEPVSPAVVAEPAELLPNGEAQLPLDASEHVLRRASVAQLRDLSKRKGEGQSRPGAFGTRF